MVGHSYLINYFLPLIKLSTPFSLALTSSFIFSGSKNAWNRRSCIYILFQRPLTPYYYKRSWPKKTSQTFSRECGFCVWGWRSITEPFPLAMGKRKRDSTGETSLQLSLLKREKNMKWRLVWRYARLQPFVSLRVNFPHKSLLLVLNVMTLSKPLLVLLFSRTFSEWLTTRSSVVWIISFWNAAKSHISLK